MKILYFFVFCAVLYKCNTTDSADVLSNYAKVYVNSEGNSTIGKLSISTEPLNSTSSEEDEAEGYDDFDDSTATTERPRSAVLDGQSMIKAVGGFISLLTLMNQFSGKRSPTTREAKPRNSGSDPLAADINGLVEEARYTPNSAAKKFKYSQNGYPPLQKTPVYVPPAASPAESYPSDGGKTSYDADVDQYMVKNPETNSFSADDAMFKPKPALKDYMAQNESPVQVQESYSYQLPSETITVRPEMKPGGYGEQPEQHGKTAHEDQNDSYHYKQPEDHQMEEKPAPAYYPWMGNKPLTKPATEPSHTDNNQGYESEPKSPKNPAENLSYYPWMASSKKPKLRPLQEYLEDVPSWAQTPPKRAKPMPPPPPLEDDEGPEDVPPWAQKAAKRPISPPPEDDDEPEDFPPWAPKPPKRAKPMPPPPPLEDDDGPQDMPPLPMKYGKSKPGKDPATEEHVYPYPDFHDHGLLYPGDDDFHHGNLHHDDHKEHDMQDEDRENKHPYTYYHLGRKLWYVPLLFSLYFIVYIMSLLLKSIARHKVQFPDKLWDLHEHDHHHDRKGKTLEDVTEKVLAGIDKAENKYM